MIRNEETTNETTEIEAETDLSDSDSTKSISTARAEQTETTSTIKSSSREQDATSELNFSTQDKATITSGKTFGLPGGLPKVNKTSTSVGNQSIDTTIPSTIGSNLFWLPHIVIKYYDNHKMHLMIYYR